MRSTARGISTLAGNRAGLVTRRIRSGRGRSCTSVAANSILTKAASTASAYAPSARRVRGTDHLQRASSLLEARQLHCPATHADPSPHRTPQFPQCAGSLAVSTQATTARLWSGGGDDGGQNWSGAGHWHAPATHVPVPQPTQHAPQDCWLVRGSTHTVTPGPSLQPTWPGQQWPSTGGWPVVIGPRKDRGRDPLRCGDDPGLVCWRAVRDSNPWPSAPEADALSS